MEYIKAENVLFSDIFKSEELVHFEPNSNLSIPDDGILIIKDLGNEVVEGLTNVEAKIIGVDGHLPFIVLTKVSATEKDAQVAYRGEILFLDYKPTKDQIIQELM